MQRLVRLAQACQLEACTIWLQATSSAQHNAYEVLQRLCRRMLRQTPILHRMRHCLLHAISSSHARCWGGLLMLFWPLEPDILLLAAAPPAAASGALNGCVAGAGLSKVRPLAAARSAVAGRLWPAVFMMGKMTSMYAKHLSQALSTRFVEGQEQELQFGWAALTCRPQA